MSAPAGPPPDPVTYRITVTKITDTGTKVTFDETGHAYVAAVATLTGTRIDAPIDHHGPQFLRERLLAYIVTSIYPD